MAGNFMQDEKVKRYFHSWVVTNSGRLENFSDRQSFYRFVKACVEYGRKNNLKSLDTDLLRLHLGHLNQHPENIPALFDALVEYDNTTY